MLACKCGIWNAFLWNACPACDILAVWKFLCGVFSYKLFLKMSSLLRETEVSISNLLTFAEAGLRRSPRIKQLSLNRTCSGVFYSTTQPSSQNSQLVHQGQEEESSTLQDVEGTEWDLSRLVLLIWKAGMDSSDFDLIWLYKRLQEAKIYHVISSVDRN